MPGIELVPEIVGDFDRILDHLAAHGVTDLSERVQEIVEAIDILARHPQIGRPVDGGRRELVIGRASRGYVALYQDMPALDKVVVLAIRSQREAGYSRP